jgi:hypothetical protein
MGFSSGSLLFGQCKHAAGKTRKRIMPGRRASK